MNRRSEYDAHRDLLDASERAMTADDERREESARMEFVAYVFVAVATVIVLALLLFSSKAHAAEVELIAGAGAGQWRKCGGVGCWDQPPLPTTWDLKSETKTLGVRVGDFEIAYNDLGRTGADGLYVLDEDYDASIKHVTPDAPQWTARQVQTTRALSLHYAPRFDAVGGVYVSPRIGVLAYQNKRDAWATWWNGRTDYTLHKKNGVTPSLGLAFGVKQGAVRVEAVVDAFKVVKAKHYFPTGGEPSWRKPPGLVTYSLRIAVAL